MTDLTKITTPFGLLDAETQAALKAHGGPWDVYTEKGWRENSSPMWDEIVTYRVKPSPPKPREAWSVGNHLHKTEAEAVAFRAAVDVANPGRGHLDAPIIRWVEK
jgi:hypothetical protein